MNLLETVRALWHFLAENITAISTLAIAIFAAMQFLLEFWRWRREKRAARTRAIGPAWLSRRVLEEWVRDSFDRKYAFGWFRFMKDQKKLPTLQTRVLETLNLGALAGGQTEQDAHAAFSAFLGFAEAVNGAEMKDEAGVPKTCIDYVNLGNDAFAHAKDAIRHLEALAPRRPNEPHLPSGKPKILLTPEEVEALPPGS